MRSQKPRKPGGAVHPIDTLKEEHQLILRVLDAFELYVEALRRGATQADLGRFVLFFREFADARHHGREEQVFFRVLIDHGFPRDSGPICVMLQDHENARRLLGVLAGAAEQRPRLSDVEAGEVSEATRELARLLRTHMYREDNVLYPLAEQRLPESTMQELAERFERFEQKQTGGGKPEAFLTLAEELAARYSRNDVAVVSTDRPEGGRQ
jgi:hemerythrin-like domain-containing protein